MPSFFASKSRAAAALALLLLSHLAGPPAAHATPPGVAGTLSLVPGLGQVSNGDFLEGLAWLAVIGGGVVFSPRGAWPATAFYDLWMYNMYDAYRDAGPRKSAKNNVFENYIATFNPLNLIDPIGAPLLLAKGLTPSSGPQIGPDSKLLVPFAMGFVALGEEGLFRGFLFPGFSDLLSSEVLGAVTSSLVFAAAHGLYDGQRSYAFEPMVFGTRTVLGLLFSWQTHRNKYDLRKSIFAHAWFDVIYELKRTPTAGGSLGGGEGSAPGAPSALGLRMSWEF
jgi:membrane protease YdiL (CAAX protease family)